MAWPVRMEFPGAIYHVTSRGHARLPICEGDAKRRGFLDRVGGVVERCHWLWGVGDRGRCLRVGPRAVGGWRSAWARG